jgi:hypothetical protein
MRNLILGWKAGAAGSKPEYPVLDGEQPVAREIRSGLELDEFQPLRRQPLDRIPIQRVDGREGPRRPSAPEQIRR